MRRSEWLLLVPFLVAQDGCESETETGEPEPFACELGLLDFEGAFTPLAAGDDVELQLGFQGFLIVELGVRTVDHGVPDVLDAAVSLTPDGLDAVGGTGIRVEMARDGEWEVSTPIQVFLDPARLGDYTGRPAAVAVRLEGDGRLCVAQRDVVLVDDDPCIHTGAEPECPDDTGASR